jgi:hypothetical protein
LYNTLWQDSSSIRKGEILGGGACKNTCGLTDESGCRWYVKVLLKVSRALSNLVSYLGGKPSRASYTK